MSDPTGGDPTDSLTPVAEKRRALRESIERAKARLQRLPPEEQKRLYEASRAQSPTLFALLHRLQEDPITNQLVRAAVERTRRAPTMAELTRAIARTFTSAFRAGHLAFRPAAHFALRRLGQEFGETNARRNKLSDLQRGYFAVCARSRLGGFEAAAAVMAVATLAEVRDVPPPGSIDEAPTASVEVVGSVVVEVQGDAATAAVAAGADQLLTTGLVAACLHIEAGVRGFAEFAEVMAADLGDAVRPYLRVFYEAIRHYPGIDLTAMKPAAASEGGLMFAQ